MNDLPQFLEACARDACEHGLFKMMPAEAKARGLCVLCGEPALPKCTTEMGKREYEISQTCEPCFDALFQETDE